jgi:hypothetical protein
VSGAAFFALLLPPVASAQNAEIAGIVRDASGAVLPGVTVEASSPALIERSRVVYTDGQGQYRVIALNPGQYKVTFTLPGFKTVVREGITLTAAFTAAIDASMEVGGLTETVTVSGQSPLVDVQATTQRRALTGELINELPTGRSFQNLAILVPGVQTPLIYQDVGGSDGNRWQTMKVHGSRDDQMPLLLNGMKFNNMNNTGGGYNHTLAVNTGTVQEMTITTSGSTAEAQTSGVMANTVAKEGGNRLTYAFYADFTSEGLQSDNLSEDLRARGLTAVNRVKAIGEVNPTMGGPIIKDRLWFYGGYRYLKSQKFLAGSFATKDPLTVQYCVRPEGCLYRGVLVPDSRDLTRQDFSGDRFHRTYTLNLTWQMSQRNKANFFYHLGDRWLDNDSAATQTPEATSYLYSKPDYVAQVQWTSPVTSRFLLEGGFNFFNEVWWWWQRPDSGIPIGDGPEAIIPKFELSNAALYGANHTNIRAFNHQYNVKLAANYVTGSHAFKVGVTQMWGTRNFKYFTNREQFWIFFNGAPVQITEYARPLEDLQHLKADLGLFAQDKWTIRNVTLNLGLRFDYHNAYVPDLDIPALQFVGAKHYDATLDTPSWKDLSPRAGVAWDIFSDGKTVLRANYGHYLASESVATTTANNPVNTRINSGSRTWTDSNANFFPDCDLTNRSLNGECGPLSAPLGELNIVTRWDPAVLRGWGVRPNDDEVLVGLQQQVHNRLMMDVQWTRHSFGNLFATQLNATPPEAYDTYCITAPRDSRLPGGGGNQICGFADVKPTFFGRTPDNLVRAASNFGDVTDVYNGIDVSLTARLLNGGVASGGVSVGRERTDFCSVVGKASMGANTDSSAGKIGESNITSYPSQLYCSVTPPYQPDWKGLVTYPLPWGGLSASATWQNRAGPQILATDVVTSAQTTLGRPLSLGTATVQLIAPGTMYDERLNQVDARLAKTVRIGRARVQGTFSLFNLLNASTPLTLNSRLGPTWPQPLRILQGRLIKFGAQVDF